MRDLFEEFSRSHDDVLAETLSALKTNDIITAIAQHGVNSSEVKAITTAHILEDKKNIFDCLDAVTTLSLDNKDTQADEYGRLIHKILLEHEIPQFVGVVLFTQAQIHAGKGDKMASDLFAVEAAASFEETGNLYAARKALDFIHA